MKITRTVVLAVIFFFFAAKMAVSQSTVEINELAKNFTEQSVQFH
jgi:hypothetical protein